MLSSLNPLPQLPKYQGPHKVGSCEFEIPVSELPSDSRIPDATIESIKFRVYYPTTPGAKSKTSIPWLPTPQKEGNRAYAKFLGFSDRSSGLMANLPSMLSYPTIPAVHNAPLSTSHASSWPVIVFSHGLGGNYNTYSSFVGSLASCGAVVFAPEHRDQSAPISFIRTKGDKKGRPVPYRKLSHQPRVEVLNARNDMLRVRLWELEKLFTAITALNKGQVFTNLVDSPAEAQIFKGVLDLSPSKVSWTGHSFGAATIVQFIKSVYYRQHAPPAQNNDPEGWDHTPLYTPAENGDLAKQITATSALTLLDLWTMPLTSKTTQWLWERPLPCYDRTNGDNGTPSNVISIMSTQFHKWPEMVNRTRALLSSNPVETYTKLTAETSSKGQATIEQAEKPEPSPQLSLDPITTLETSKTEGLSRFPTVQYPDEDDRDSHNSSPPSEASTRTPSPARSELSSLNASDAELSSLPSSTSSLSITTPPKQSVQPHLYLIPTSAHLSQSDFGVLFPNFTKYLLKTIDPQKIMELNVRAATAMMRNNGIKLGKLDIPELKETNKEDQILVSGAMDESMWTEITIAA